MPDRIALRLILDRWVAVSYDRYLERLMQLTAEARNRFIKIAEGMRIQFAKLEQADRHFFD